MAESYERLRHQLIGMRESQQCSPQVFMVWLKVAWDLSRLAVENCQPDRCKAANACSIVRLPPRLKS